MKKIAYLVLLFLLFSCGGNKGSENAPIIYDLEGEKYEELINHYTLTDSVLFWQSRIVANEKYPLYFALFEEGKFLYHLPGVGDGEGNWSYEKNQIKLVAKTSLFDMILYIYKMKKSYYFKFKDRFGPQVYEIDIIN